MFPSYFPPPVSQNEVNSRSNADCVLSTEKSWGGMQFSVHSSLSVWYYYPRSDNSDGSHPEAEACWSATRRPIDPSRNEIGEWVLLDASPATCANAGLFNQPFFTDAADGYTSDSSQASSSSSSKKQLPPFDLVISGPNYGRNTGNSFALGSGTVGAALAASLTGVRAISVSYGLFANPPEHFKEFERKYASKDDGNRPNAVPASSDAPSQQTDSQSRSGSPQVVPFVTPTAPPEIVRDAHQLSVKIIKRLWDEWESEVGVYSINIPIAWTLKEPRVFWTKMWRGKHGRLFKEDQRKEADPLAVTSDLTNAHRVEHVPPTAPTATKRLRFQPHMQAMLAPKQLPEGTDICESRRQQTPCILADAPQHAE